MSRLNKDSTPLVNNLIETILQLVVDFSQDNTNPSTFSIEELPSLNKSVKFTDQELDRLGEVINSQEQSISQDKIAIDKKKLKEDLKEELKEELESKRTTTDQTETKTGKKFKQELVTYSSNYTPLQITFPVQEKIRGIICEVESDFIEFFDSKNNFIKLPIDKIIAVKEIEELKKNNSPQPEANQTEQGVKLPAPEELVEKDLERVKAELDGG